MRSGCPKRSHSRFARRGLRPVERSLTPGGDSPEKKWDSQKWSAESNVHSVTQKQPRSVVRAHHLAISRKALSLSTQAQSASLFHVNPRPLEHGVRFRSLPPGKGESGAENDTA